MAKAKSAIFTLSGKLLRELRKMAKRDNMPVTDALKLAIIDSKFFNDKGHNVLIVNNESTTRVNWR